MRKATVVIVLLASLLTGCLRDAVVFATHTTLGLEIAATTENQAAVEVGYTRVEGVTMPVIREWRVPHWQEPSKEPIEHEKWVCGIWLLGRALCRVERRERRVKDWDVVSIARLNTGGLTLQDLGDEPTEVSQIFATGAAARHPGTGRVAAMMLRGDALLPSDELAADRLRELVAKTGTDGTRAREIVGKCLVGKSDAAGDADTAKLLVDAAQKHRLGHRLRQAVEAYDNQAQPVDACP